nr:uncharacterized protein LOC112712731 [Arachis hypogaea]
MRFDEEDEIRVVKHLKEIEGRPMSGGYNLRSKNSRSKRNEEKKGNGLPLAHCSCENFFYMLIAFWNIRGLGGTGKIEMIKVRLKTMPRSLSDHCPLLVDSGVVDWDPKPFRTIDAWLTYAAFKETGILLKKANLTWVTLAHKEGGSNDLKDYRPISMVGCVYKVVAKILSKRLQSFMPELVGEEQSAFVSGRKIIDEALIACEVVHWVRKKKIPTWLIKLDFQKAYDRIWWSFVDRVLKSMGFGEVWRSWIRTCLSTASMSVLVNGTTTKPFKLQRGLRQGDPLSPFLFVMVSQVLNSTLGRLCEKGRIRSLDIGHNRVSIMHLQFADDTILFCPCDHKPLMSYKRLLGGFELITGLKINYNKSVLIGVNCNNEEVELACKTLDCRKGSLPMNYLGIPLGANPRRIETWKPVIRKVEDRLKGWKSRHLSKAGKLVLIKAVLNNLPMYYLNLFKMPKAMAAKITSLQSSMQRQLGDGTRTLFWDDVWMKDGRLRDRFSNLYRVAVDKARAPSVIVAFGMGMYGVGLQWRRALWSWEEQELSELQTGLAKVGIRQSEVDKLIWKHDKEERVNTKDRLVRCRILPTSEIICVICGKAPESVHHLFFTCEYAWKLWGSALRFWNILWVWAGDPRQCFESWIYGANRKSEKEDWMTTFFAVIWSL